MQDGDHGSVTTRQVSLHYQRFPAVWLLVAKTFSHISFAVRHAKRLSRTSLQIEKGDAKSMEIHGNPLNVIGVNSHGPPPH